MKSKILWLISISLFLALVIGCIDDKPIIERSTAEKQGSILKVDAWIKNREWGSFVEVTAEAIAKDTGLVMDKQVKEIFIEKGETRHISFDLNIENGKDYQHRVDARYTQGSSLQKKFPF